MPLQRPEARSIGYGNGNGNGHAANPRAHELQEAAHRMPADFSEDDLENDEGSDASSHTDGGTPKMTTRVKGMAQSIKTAIDKRLHLELFGITWFDFAAISCARWLFLFALMGAAAGLASSVYIRLRSEEIHNFESEVSLYLLDRLWMWLGCHHVSVHV